MFTVDTKNNTVSHDPKSKRAAQEPAANMYFIETKEDIDALPNIEIVEIYNSLVKAMPEMKWREVARFGDHASAVRRLWGLFVSLKALALEMDKSGASVSTDISEAVPIPPPSDQDREPKMRKVRKAKTVNGERVPKLRDKEVPKAAKVYPIRPGTMQAFAYDLVSRPKSDDNPKGGISVDDFVAEMNKQKRAKYTRGNAWSALVFILHANKGYGIRLKDERFHLIK